MSQYQAEINQIRDILKKNPRGLTVTEVGTILGFSRNSAAKYLDVMLSSEEVEVREVGRARIFYLSQRVRLAALLEYSSTLMIVVNNDLDIVQANAKMLNDFGVSKSDLIGKNLINDIFFDNRYEQAVDFIVNLIKSEEKEAELLVQGNTLFVRLFPTTFSDGSEGSTLIFEDISERRRFSQTLVSLHKFSKELVDVDTYVKSWYAYGQDYVPPYKRTKDFRTLVDSWTDDDIITLARDQEYLDAHGGNIINDSPNSDKYDLDYGAEILEKVRSGQYGWKPKSGKLVKLSTIETLLW